MSKSRTKNSRKNRVMKESSAHRKATLDRKRRDPAFRNHERKSREEVTLAVDYITLVVDGENAEDYLKTDASQEIINRMGGIPELHAFLYMLDALKDDWEERLDAKGLLLISAISPDGIEFVLQNEDEKNQAIG